MSASCWKLPVDLGARLAGANKPQAKLASSIETAESQLIQLVQCNADQSNQGYQQAVRAILSELAEAVVLPPESHETYVTPRFKEEFHFLNKLQKPSKKQDGYSPIRYYRSSVSPVNQAKNISYLKSRLEAAEGLEDEHERIKRRRRRATISNPVERFRVEFP